MSERHPALWRNITKRFRDCRGNALLSGMLVVLAICALFMLCFELWRVVSVTDEVQKKVTATITSLAASHIYDSYSPVRDGTSGAFVFEGVSFTEIKDTSGFGNTFSSLYSNSIIFNGKIQVVRPQGYLYEISELSIMVHNGGRDSTESTYRVEYTIAIPQDLFWSERSIVLKNQVQKVHYMGKY